MQTTCLNRLWQNSEPERQNRFVQKQQNPSTIYLRHLWLRYRFPATCWLSWIELIKSNSSLLNVPEQPIFAQWPASSILIVNQLCSSALCHALLIRKDSRWPLLPLTINKGECTTNWKMIIECWILNSNCRLIKWVKSSTDYKIAIDRLRRSNLTI